jgi:hypothetical protein
VKISTRILIGVLLSALVLLAYLTCGFTWVSRAEDGPLWDCHTRGNHVCGSDPVGTRLQTIAGDQWEVVWDPVRSIFTVEPKSESALEEVYAR